MPVFRNSILVIVPFRIDNLKCGVSFSTCQNQVLLYSLPAISSVMVRKPLYLQYASRQRLRSPSVSASASSPASRELSPADDTTTWRVVAVIAIRLSSNKLQYLTAWEGYAPEDYTWEPATSFKVHDKTSRCANRAMIRRLWRHLTKRHAVRRQTICSKRTYFASPVFIGMYIWGYSTMPE
ncbi:hypothetical protein BDZ89DRAFT_1151157 [Hymenopellis radicata]|nr:hypothetical protein BDZ89DRAFT_1151157 [Hymenopellis radicata]